MQGIRIAKSHKIQANSLRLKGFKSGAFCLSLALILAPGITVAANKTKHKTSSSNVSIKAKKPPPQLEVEANPQNIEPLQAPENTQPHMLPFDLPDLPPVPMANTNNTHMAPKVSGSTSAELIMPLPAAAISGETKSYRHFTSIPYKSEASEAPTSELNKIFAVIKKEHPTYTLTSVLAEVYADRSVPPDLSLRFSQVLAHNTQKQLQRLGVAPERLQSIGLGSEKAKECQSSNASCRALNRHIDITVVFTAP